MGKKVRVIIAGGRDMDDTDFAFPIIDNLLSNISKDDLEIVDGTARGADTVGRLWAEKNGIAVRHFKPDWSRGRSAGHIRNREMGEYATHLIAFWDEKSRGTQSMINIAKMLKLEMRVIHYRKLGDGKCAAPEAARARYSRPSP